MTNNKTTTQDSSEAELDEILKELIANQHYNIVLFDDPQIAKDLKESKQAILKWRQDQILSARPERKPLPLPEGTPLMIQRWKGYNTALDDWSRNLGVEDGQ